MLLVLIIGNFLGLIGMRAFNKRAQDKIELRQWAPFRQNPAIDKVLRHYAPVIEDPKRRWAADKIKNTTRNFVNSESFSIAVDGVINQESGFWNLGRRLRNIFKSHQGDTDVLQPLDKSDCSIQ